MRSIISIGLGLLILAGCCMTEAAEKSGGKKKTDAERQGSLAPIPEDRGEKLSMGYEWFNAAAQINGAKAEDDILENNSKAVIDGNKGTSWTSAYSDKSHYLEVSFLRNYPVSRIIIYPCQNSLSLEYKKDYTLQYMTGTEWKDIEVEKVEIPPDRRSVSFSFKPIDTGKIRFVLLKTGTAGSCGLFELEAYATVPGQIKLANGVSITEQEMALLPHSLIGDAFKLDNGWKFEIGDSPDYAKVDFDDSSWQTALVRTDLRQVNNDGWVWYRVNFDLPQGWEEKNILLDIGQLSAYDEIYLNGKKVVTYGDPEALIYLKFFLHRRYPLPAGALNSGVNLLAVRVKVKTKCILGLYNWPALQEYQPIFGKLAMKNNGSDAVKTLLTTSEHLNRYRNGDEIVVKPELFSFYGEGQRGEITLTVFDADNQKILAKKAPASCTDRAGNAEEIIRFAAPAAIGKYRAELRFTADGKTLWSKDVNFEVCNELTFAIPANAAINQYPEKDFTVEVSKYAVGAYGPNQIDFKKEVLYDGMPEFQGGLSFSMRTDKESVPLIFMSNVRPSPRQPIARDVLSQFEGFEDAWFFGYITPGGKRGKFDMKLSQASWSGRTYTYTYPDGVNMDFTIGNASPAYRVKTNAKQLKIFDRLADWDIGLPAFIGYESKTCVKVVPASAGIKGEDMSANWLMVYFNGAKNFDEFDIPFLFVLEKRPVKVKNNDGALVFDFPKNAGTVQGMPLYGVTLLPPDKTAGWNKALPKKVVERCRFWSKALLAAPTEIVRTAKIDYDKDQVIIRDQFKRLDIKDDWNTRPIKLTFLPPTFPLAAGSGNIKMEVANPVRDLQYATLHGPLLAAENGDEQRTRISNLLRFVREVRVVEPAETAQANEIRVKLNELAEKDWEQKLCQHPWWAYCDKPIFYGPKDTFFRPSELEPDYTNLLLALPYLDQPLRDKIIGEIKKETEKYLFYKDKPEAAWADKLNKGSASLPQIVNLRNPQTGLTVSAFPGYPCGTDAACWENLRIYMAWSYAWRLNEYDFVKQHYDLLKNFFNLVRSTHDWSVSISWDVFGGIRTGGGLQESTIMHAGSVAMARLARKFGDQETFERASYHAVLQLVGVQAVLAASDYLRNYHPWSSGISSAAEIEKMQALLPRYFAEANEFAGFHQMIILGAGRTLCDSSYCMTPIPEVMRPSKDLWGDFGDEFFTAKQEYEIMGCRQIRWLWFDKLFYQANKYPMPLDELMKIRLRETPDWRDGLANYRSMLDYLGKVRYEKLW